MSAVAPGTRLGPYEVVAPLGAGGMGEVWRARDTRLGREVALKVLPAAYATDAALRARIEREAKAISGLNHPHICTLYDIGRDGDVEYLVLELLEGETLAARIARGALPTSETLRLGIQIADALERAHRAGIVHRDLKPGNVIVTKSGAKLLDFGLARGSALVPSAERQTISPTLAEPLTEAGHIVGTFQYMAPEQLEGAEPDPRSDLWALGCVLYEMATGRAPFKGGSPASLISAILKDEPRAMSELAPLSPPALERVVRQCLAKDPEERWQTAGDLRRELAWISSSGSQAAPAVSVAPVRKAHPVRKWAMPLLAGAAVVAVAWWAFGRSRPGEPLRLSVVHDGGGIVLRDPAYVSISPDGQRIAYVVTDSMGMSLWVRRLSEPSSRMLVRSKGAIWLPFWSPSGRDLAYFTPGEDGKLWRIPATGGDPFALASATSPRGGTWSRRGVIVYAPDPSGPLHRVSESGGEATVLTVLDSTRGQTSHRGPEFLPDGDHFLYVGLPGTERGLELFAGSLGSSRSELIGVLPQSGAVYAEPGYLLYNRAGKLVAQRFDAGRRKLSGEPAVLAEATGLTDLTGKANVSASRNGRIAWRPTFVSPTRLEWVDREGRLLEVVETIQGSCLGLAVHRDGRRFLGHRAHASGAMEVFHYDPDRGSVQRASPPGFDGDWSVWHPDGESFLMEGSRGMGPHEIYRQSLAGGAPERIATTDHQFKRPTGVTPDGRTLVFGALNRATDWDVYRLEIGSGREPEVMAASLGQDMGVASPDGRWLAVRATSPGRRELLILPMDRSRSPRRVVARVDADFEWGREGRELYYDQVNGEERSVFVVPVDPATGSATGPGRLLFTRRNVITWASAPDGDRFLLALTERSLPPDIRVDVDWPALLPK